MEKNIEFLYKYLNNASPTGFEYPGQQIWLDYVRPFIDETIIDNYGTAVGVINPGQDYSVAIEAHADEISWFVNYITPEGYIYVIRNGGSDHQIAPSMRVNLHTRKNGIIKGVFGWPAIHVRNAQNEEAPSLKNIFVDVGASTAEEVAEMGITVGTVITFEDGLTELNNKYYTGRALDNRMGGYMIAEVARKLHENKIKLPFTLYVVNAVQEEIGLRGAEMISRKLKPDVAIVTDVTHDTQSPMYDKKKSGDVACGKGPTVCYGPAVQNNLLNFIIDTAEEKNIPIQRQATSRSTGTDTDAFAYSGEGVPSALMSLPLKYMHTTVETVSKGDVQSCIDLFYELLLKLESGQDFKYIK
ncbi:M42 family metallopeptidase [uncultured Arcticibacterium sp.]|uniref:M42 family metallopeptidase n=1 Tax=uncultured Arcticibacterium sp. TaxID=2173042 RepID=UPI0030F8D7CA